MQWKDMKEGMIHFVPSKLYAECYFFYGIESWNKLSKQNKNAKACIDFKQL